MGIVISKNIEDKLVRREILAQVLMEAQRRGALDNPAVVQTISINGRHGQLPKMSNVDVYEDVKELETNPISSANFDAFKFDMQKNRIKIAVSDETELENAVADPLSLEIKQAGQKLASVFDRQIADKIDTNPQKLKDITLGTDNFFKSVAEAAGKLKPYNLTAMCMNRETFYQILSAVELRGQYCVQQADGRITIPNLPDVPAIISDNLTTVPSAGYVWFVSSEVPAAIVVNGATKTRVWDDNNMGAKIFQSDVYRCVESCIQTNDSGLNLGVARLSVMY